MYFFFQHLITMDINATESLLRLFANRSDAVDLLKEIQQERNLSQNWTAEFNDTGYGNITDHLYRVPTTGVVILSLFYGTISFVAIAGNALVFWIASTSRRVRNTTNYFIANLALADIIIAIFVIPFQFQVSFKSFSEFVSYNRTEQEKGNIDMLAVL